MYENTLLESTIQASCLLQLHVQHPYKDAFSLQVQVMPLPKSQNQAGSPETSELLALLVGMFPSCKSFHQAIISVNYL
jgi:hypothetical protein